ncbi:uncharacterized protein MEPE_01705 [Melanopsichium pennsylvanicum]|uniref:Uncharacterized protein n=1 Tax=Melanopsichium pennsylvanicum TaxID=63383 RepID=A0AAJ4XII3_9BASI|nr:uncharacterized protein MEPE_01705 [Melanopsichium pennsylvanicum]
MGKHRPQARSEPQATGDSNCEDLLNTDDEQSVKVVGSGLLHCGYDWLGWPGTEGLDQSTSNIGWEVLRQPLPGTHNPTGSVGQALQLIVVGPECKSPNLGPNPSDLGCNQLSRIVPILVGVSAPPTVVQRGGAWPPSQLSDCRDQAPTDPLRTPCSGAVGLTRSSYRPTAAGPSLYSNAVVCSDPRPPVSPTPTTSPYP